MIYKQEEPQAVVSRINNRIIRQQSASYGLNNGLLLLSRMIKDGRLTTLTRGLLISYHDPAVMDE